MFHRSTTSRAPVTRRPRRARRSIPRGPNSYINKAYKFLIKQDVTETTAKWPVPAWINFDETFSQHPVFKQFTSLKVLRVGIEVPPATYLEAIIREHIVSSLNTRRELRNQQDLRIFGPVRANNAYMWRRPGEGALRYWQDVDSTVETGLHACICGKNDLVPDDQGILCSFLIELLVKGANTALVSSGFNFTNHNVIVRELGEAD